MGKMIANEGGAITCKFNSFEEDNTVPYSNLPSEIGEYPEFDDAVSGYNKGAFYFALAVGCCIIINFGISTDFLINGDGVYNYNLGSRTVTGLLTVRPACGAKAQPAAPDASLATEHYAREHQGAGLFVIRAIKLFKRMVRDAAAMAPLLRSRARCRAISMFSVVPVSYNVVDEMCKERKPRQLDPIDISPA
jgi:hypothetical protein